jgi:hypothetical protein
MYINHSERKRKEIYTFGLLSVVCALATTAASAGTHCGNAHIVQLGKISKARTAQCQRAVTHLQAYRSVLGAFIVLFT